MRGSFWLSVAGMLFFGVLNAQTLTPFEFKNAIADSGAVILDVRTPGEYDSGHIKGAVNLSVEDPHFITECGMLDENKTYYVYCGIGVRSAKAASLMRTQGFEKVFELGDGFVGWPNHGYPVVKGKE